MKTSVCNSVLGVLRGAVQKLREVNMEERSNPWGHGGEGSEELLRGRFTWVKY